MHVIELEIGKNTLKYSAFLLIIIINSVITEKNYIITCYVRELNNDKVSPTAFSQV